MIEKGVPMEHQLSLSHYAEILLLKDINKINHYIGICNELRLIEYGMITLKHNINRMEK